MRCSRKKPCFRLGVSILVVGLLLSACCWSFNVWSINGAIVYVAMKKECHPAWRDYHFGRIRAGNDVTDVFVKTEPENVEYVGSWTILKYGKGSFCCTGLTAIAHDGQMVGAWAWSCTWSRQFF